jgi:anti-sigma B factor antagonist
VAQVPDGNSFLMAGGVPVVTAPDQIDIATAGQLRAMLTGWAARGHTTLVVDLTGTQFCDSAGLSVLVRAHKQALDQGGGLRLVLPASGAMVRVFTLTGLDHVIPHFASLEQALAQAPAVIRPPRPRRSPGMRSRAGRTSPGPEGAENHLSPDRRQCGRWRVTPSARSSGGRRRSSH